MIAILNYVLLGIFIYIVGIPLLEEVSAIFIQGLEVVKGKLVLKVAEMQKAVEEEPVSAVNAIGFAIPTDDYYDEEEDDDDDD